MLTAYCKNMEAIAKTKYLKGSPRKARLVIDLIRGRNVSRALNILKFTDKRAADPIAKCLNSAIANATYQAEQQNIAIDPDDLWVKTCFIDMGPTKHRRRMRPAPQGRAYREQRHYCHITILVSSDEIVAKDVKKEKVTEKKAKSSAKTSAKKDEVKETKKTKKKESKAAEVETKTTEPIVDEVVEETTPKVAENVQAVVEEKVEAETNTDSEEEVEKA
jgi:large subunit ribosomal protein L22